MYKGSIPLSPISSVCLFSTVIRNSQLSPFRFPLLGVFGFKSSNNSSTTFLGVFMTAKEKIENYLEMNGDDETSVIVFENPDYSDALIGISSDNRAIYSYDKMIECLMNEDKMTYDEAVEFIDYNTLGAFYSAMQPIIMFSIES